MTLRMIARVDFRSGVPTHYDELRKRGKLDDLSDNECLLLISGTGLQLAFVFIETDITTNRGDEVKVIAHYRLQLSRHTPWSPMMLAEYAAEAGIELIGIKRFAEHLKIEQEA